MLEERQKLLLKQTACKLLEDLEEAAKENDPNVFTHETQARMKNLRNVLEGKEPELTPGPPFLVECPQCRSQFWVDPSDEENTCHGYSERLGMIVLKDKCPNCGAVKE